MRASTLYLTSSSPLKLAAVKEVYGQQYNVECVTQSTFTLPEQPINEHGIMCAKMRIDGCRSQLKLEKGDVILSIESYINEVARAEDVCCIIEYADSGTIETIIGRCVVVPKDLYNDYKNNHAVAAPWGGYTSTYGEYLLHNGHTMDAKDWYHRADSIRLALSQLKHGNLTNVRMPTRDSIYAYLDYFNDFPKPGVIFTSLGSLMSHPVYNASLVRLMRSAVREVNFDYIIGLETRGLHIGAILAHLQGTGFQMARKAGKLPNKDLLSTSYSTEYSKDCIELAPLVGLQKAKHILIIDDLVATGGSVCAVAKAIRERYPDKVISCYAPLKVPALESMAQERFKDANIKWL